MKAALYCRLSEEDRCKADPAADSQSIQNQKAMLLAYAREQGWDVYRLYSDDDYTGADRNRPAFQQLLRDAQAKRFNIVLCKTQSRFTREMEVVETYLHGLFPLWGIRFVSIVDHADTANKGNKKARQINGLINEWYLEDMSDSIKSVLDAKRRAGCHIGAFALYGYRKDPARKGHLLVDEEAAAVVQEAFRLFAAGQGKTEIARRFNARGLLNPTAYKQQKGLSYRQAHGGTRWTYATVGRLLTNEIYCGNMVQGRYGSVSYKTKQNRPRPRDQWFRVEGTHEAIISPALWQRVQERLRKRARPGTPVPNPLAGKVYCISCGCPLRISSAHGKRYLRCPTHTADRAACPGVFLELDALETALLDELRRLTQTMLGKQGDWDALLAQGMTMAMAQIMLDRVQAGPRQENRIPVQILWKF
ncbi:MAG: recombinase family protein [Butyricicoccus sp.]|nr:recombinase family protein [Butyricicoccus sp.]